MRLTVFHQIKPHTNSILQSLSKTNQESSLQSSIQSIHQIIHQNLQDLNPSLIYYTLYPFQHLFSTRLFHQLQSQTINLSLQTIIPIIHHLIQLNQLSLASIDQLSHFLQFALDHHLLNLINSILNSSPSIKSIPLPIQFIPIIFNSLLQLIPDLQSINLNPQDAYETLSILRITLHRLSISSISSIPQSTHDGLRLISTILPKTVSILTQLIISLSTSTSPSIPKIHHLTAQAIDLLNWLLLESFNDQLFDLDHLSRSEPHLNPSPLPLSADPSQALVTRDHTWLITTLSKITQVLKLLSNVLDHHSHPEVRRAWAHLASNLLHHTRHLLSHESRDPSSTQLTAIQGLCSSLIILRSHPENWQEVDQSIDQTLSDLIHHSPLDLAHAITHLIRQQSHALALLFISQARDEDAQLLFHSRLLTSALNALLALVDQLVHPSHRTRSSLVKLLNDLFEHPDLERIGRAILRATDIILPKLSVISALSTSSLPPISLRTFSNPRCIAVLEGLMRKFAEILVALHQPSFTLDLKLSEIFLFDFLLRLITDHAGDENSLSVRGERLSALWLLAESIRGISPRLAQASPSRQKRIEGFLLKTVGTLLELDQEPPSSAHPRQPESTQEVIELPQPTSQLTYHRGLHSLPELEKWRPVTQSAHQDATLAQEIYLQLRSCFILRTIAAISTTLTSALQPALATMLYPILRHLDPSRGMPYLHLHTQQTLSELAYETGYASVRNMMADNLDYVVDTAARHLMPHRMPDVHAPWVLAYLVETVGVREALPLVGDVLIEDCGEALTDFHLSEELCGQVVASYARIIGLMVLDLQAQPPARTESFIPEPDEPDKALDEFELADRLEHQRRDLLALVRTDDPRAELALFQAWHHTRVQLHESYQKARLSDLPLNSNPRQPFEADPCTETETVVDAEEVKPEIGHYERVTLGIVTQTAPLLSHPQFTTHVARLMTMAVVGKLLRNTEAIVPVLRRFWPVMVHQKQLGLIKALVESECFGMYFAPKLDKDRELWKIVGGGGDGGERRRMGEKEAWVWEALVAEERLKVVKDVHLGKKEVEVEEVSVELLRRARRGEVKGMEFMKL